MNVKSVNELKLSKIASYVATVPRSRGRRGLRAIPTVVVLQQKPSFLRLTLSIIRNKPHGHTHRAILAERAGFAIRRGVAAVQRRVSNCLIRQEAFCQILKGAPIIARLLLWGLWRGVPGGARRRGRFGPRARLRVRRRLPGRSSISLKFVMSRPADDRVLELSAATVEALLNGLFKAAVAVTDNKTSNLNQNVSRVAS